MKRSEEGNVLEVRQLGVRFGKSTVFSDLTFEVARGAALAIIGPNGSGKTVLFKALIGAIPHDGDIRWAGGTRLGYVPQKLDIDRDLPVTADDFLHAKAAVSGARAEDISRALVTVDFSPKLLRKPIGALSGGQFQRLLVAVALLGHPDALLLDEAAAGVDEPGQHTLYETIDRLRAEGMTVLLISHDLSVVYAHATRVLCLARTRTCVGAPRAILTPELLAEIYGAPVHYHVHDDGPPS